MNHSLPCICVALGMPSIEKLLENAYREADAGETFLEFRLDYLQDRPVAALVYQRRGHTINVFVLPARDGGQAPASPGVHHGYQLAQWEQSGMRFWAVSDISRDEMTKFATALKAAL